MEKTRKVVYIKRIQKNIPDKITLEIRNEIYRTFLLLGQGSELLAIIGSWMDTFPDKVILQMLKDYNTDIEGELHHRLDSLNDF